MPTTRRIPVRALGLAAALTIVSPALAQTNVDSVNKYSWSENCGWMNWREAGSPAGQQGAYLDRAGGFLSGFVWCENIGWINLGNSNGPYANSNDTNFGVNHNALTGALTGYAWGENVGWINFSGGALASPPQPARVDLATGRLRGYAWGENIGWINLDDPTRFVGFATCPADFNQSGAISVQDIFDFLAAYFAGDPRADFNHSGAISVQDIFDFLAAYFAGCA
jgi:hypothetical protein